jgi:hypothetical protein
LQEEFVTDCWMALVGCSIQAVKPLIAVMFFFVGKGEKFGFDLYAKRLM